MKMSDDDWDDTVAGPPTSYYSNQSRKAKNKTFQDADSTWTSGVQMYHVGNGQSQNGVRDSHSSSKVLDEFKCFVFDEFLRQHNTEFFKF